MAIEIWGITSICSMVLVYVTYKTGHKNGINVGKYSSTMNFV
jgi:hypothetical protein